MGLSVPSRRTKIAVELDKETRVVLFDIVRELLTNVIKHAQAKHVDVQIRKIDATVQIKRPR